MAGLTRKKVTVRTKRGKTYQRSVMVRAGEAVRRAGSFLNRHKGKIAAGVGAAALGAGALALAHKRGHIDLHGMASNIKEIKRSISGAVRGAAGRAAFKSAGHADAAIKAVGTRTGNLASRVRGAFRRDKPLPAAPMMSEPPKATGAEAKRSPKRKKSR